MLLLKVCFFGFVNFVALVFIFSALTEWKSGVVLFASIVFDYFLTFAQIGIIDAKKKKKERAKT